MATMYKGNQLWKVNQDPISESNPVHTKDVNSDAIKTQLNALASEEKLELVRELLEDINGSTATEETLATAKGVLDSLNAKDFATDTTLASVKAELEQVRQLLTGVATENKLEQARVLLDTISTKDFATSSNQDALKTVVDDLKSELLLVKSELATIKANQLSGEQKVQLSGKIVEEIVLFNQVEIRDTAIYNSVVIPSTVLSKIRDFDIFITDTNTHGNTVKPAMSLSFHPNTSNQDTSFLSYSPDNKSSLYNWRVAPIDVAARFTLVTEIPELNGPWFSSASVTPYQNMSVWHLLGMANIRFYNRITEVVDDELNDKTKFLNTIKSSVLNAGIDLKMQIKYLTAPTMGSITAKFRGIV